MIFLLGIDFLKVLLLRASTSVASNYRAVCRARSRKAFYCEMGIVVEISDEVVFWLEIIRDIGIINSDTLQNLIEEENEILSILASSRKTAGRNLNQLS
jgi:four helix bundle protein